MTKRPTNLALKNATFILLILLCLAGCKDDPNPQEERVKAISATWNVQSVTNDGTDVTSQYSDFTLTLSTDKTFRTTNGGNPWPSSGAFDFVDANTVDRVRRSDDVIITISEVTTTGLVLNFSMNNVRSGIEGITGNFSFSLQKQ